MRCHCHPRSEAVAICISCGRGVCHDCLRSGVDGCTVCSAECDELAAKRKGLSLAMAESVSANARSYYMLAGVLTLLEVVCVLMAFAILIWDYILPVFRIRVSALEWIEAIGITVAFAMLGVVCWYAARAVRKIGDKFAEAERQLR